MAKLTKEQYIVETLNKHIEKISAETGKPGYKGKFFRNKNRWNFSCPFCREGKSWGREHRFWYDLNRNFVHCYNGGCRVNGLPEHYIAQLEGISEVDVVKEYLSISDVKEEFKKSKTDSTQVMTPIELPDHAIHLNDIKKYEP